MAANDPAAQRVRRDDPAAGPATTAIAASLSHTVPGRGSLGQHVAGFTYQVHDEQCDAHGVVSNGGGLWRRSPDPDFWQSTTIDPAYIVVFPDGRKLPPFAFQQVYLGGAWASGRQAGQTLMIFGLSERPFYLDTDTAAVRLVYRHYAGPDGWLRLSMRLLGGATFERISVRHSPGLAERDERLWFNGAEAAGWKHTRYDLAERLPLDPSAAGAVWFASGLKSPQIAGFGVFSSRFGATYGVGTYGGDSTAIITTGATAEFRWMAKPSNAFGNPADEIAAFAKQLPSLRTSLERTSLLLPLDATGLVLDTTARATMSRLIADAGKLGGAEQAASDLQQAVADYDRLSAALRAAADQTAKLDLEAELVQARARIERGLVPLCDKWAAVGGVPAKQPAKPPGKPAAPAPIPFDERYDVEAPSDGPPLTAWHGAQAAQSRLSVLVIHGQVDNWDGYGRKIAELKRTLDLDLAYAVAVVSNTMGSRGDADRLRRLLQSRRWDVILDWAVMAPHGNPDNLMALPADVRAQLYRAVLDQGTGLVVLSPGWERSQRAAAELCRTDRVQPSDAAQVLAGLAVAGRLPRLRRGLQADAVVSKAYELFSVGAGTAIQVMTNDGEFGAPARNPVSMYEASEFEPWSLDDRVDADYFHAELGRILWRAAGRTPGVAVLSGPGTVSALPGQAPPAAAWRIRAGSGLAQLAATVRIRGLDGTVVAQRQHQLAPGDSEIPLAAPALGAGHWYADLFIDSGRGRENYGYAVISVPGIALGVAFDPVRLADGSLVAMGLPEGTDCSGTVSLPETATLPTGATMRVRLRDEFGRMLAEQATAIVPGTPTAFHFATRDIERIPLRVEAQLLDSSGCVVGAGSGGIHLLLQRRDRFHVSVAGGPGDPWWRWTLRELWRLGVTVAGSETTSPHGNMGSSLFSGMGNLIDEHGNGRQLSLLTAYNLDWDEASGRRILPPNGWNSREGRSRMLDMVEHAWAKTRSAPSPMTVIYDEGSITCADTSEVGMQAWQAWLKKTYRGDIAALNREWNSSFTDFAAIDSTTGRMSKELRGDHFEVGALAAGNPARWADRALFANQNYCDLILDGFTERARRADPGARVGLSGTFVEYQNFRMDYDAWLKSSGFWAPYAAPRGTDGLVMDLIRSNRPPGYLYSCWMGYTNGSELPVAWDVVFKGGNGLWWFQFPGDGPANRGALGLTGRNDKPYAVRRQLIDQAFLPLRRGLGDLLIRLDQQADAVAIYHSPQIALANHGANVGGANLGREYADAAAAAAATSDLIRDCGREFLYLTKGRVLAGDLRKLGIKLLFLPLVQPLGEDEIAAFRAFVAGGGVLVADQRPGVLSGHIRPIPHGPADALFGITRTGPGHLAGGSMGDTSVLGTALSLGSVAGDSHLKPAGGTPRTTVNGVPMLIEHRFGTGATWLLNTSFVGYTQVRETAGGDAWRKLFAALAVQAGLAKPVALAVRSDGSNPLTRLVLWRSGGVRIYGVLDGSGSGTLTLPAPAVLFDLRKGSLGTTAVAPIAPFAADTAHFIAAYAYDPGRPQVTVGRAEDQVVACAITMSGVPVGETGTFSYHTRLSDPQGRWTDIIPWSVQGAGGKAALRIRFALDDAPGVWSLMVREVTTGRETTATIIRR